MHSMGGWVRWIGGGSGIFGEIFGKFEEISVKFTVIRK